MLPYIKLLYQTKVYEMGKIKSLIDQVKTRNKPNIKQWKELVLEATFSMNQSWYNELMQLVR